MHPSISQLFASFFRSNYLFKRLIQNNRIYVEKYKYEKFISSLHKYFFLPHPVCAEKLQFQQKHENQFMDIIYKNS